MGRKCFVPGCKSGYDSSQKSEEVSKERRHFFTPSEAQLESWTRAISRKDRILTRKDSICDLHFSEACFEKHFEHRVNNELVRIERGKWKLKDSAVPSVLPLMEMDIDSRPEDLSVSIPMGPPVVTLSHGGRGRGRGKGSPMRFKEENISSDRQHPPRRSLRPRAEKNYAETPDVIMVSDEERFVDEDSDDECLEMPPLPPVKEYTEKEMEERELLIRTLKEELRNEEMKLVLMRKLRQHQLQAAQQQMKEATAVPLLSSSMEKHGGAAVKPQQPLVGSVPRIPQAHSLPKAPSGLTVTPALPKGTQILPAKSPYDLLSKDRSGSPLHTPPPYGMTSHSQRSRDHQHSLSPNLFMAQQGLHGRGLSPHGGRGPPNMVMGFPPEPKLDTRVPREAHTGPAMTTTSQSPMAAHSNSMRQEEAQNPAQKQAAAKLALRKQLEKTLLQIPPPKPPPPEMHFIPNAANTEFIYLVGLETVVDYVLHDCQEVLKRPDHPFRCSQCATDFSSVWKSEKNEKSGEPQVMCEQCMTTTVKKALKAEHTNRLKSAFVKALQQEQEIEQRMARSNSPLTPPPAQCMPPSPAPPPPPPPPPKVEKPPPQVPQMPKISDPKFFSSHMLNAAAAAQAHQQLLRSIPHSPHQPLPAHLLSPFNPLLYPYQLAALAAAGAGKSSAVELQRQTAELQRQAAELQRQYLLDMIPPSTFTHGLKGWKH